MQEELKGIVQEQVSIPTGSIKIVNITINNFFPVVSIPTGSIKILKLLKKIMLFLVVSIPTGSIKMIFQKLILIR